MIALPGGCDDPVREVAGLTLIERLFRQLSALGIEDIVVVTARQEGLPRPSRRVSARVRVLSSRHDDAWALVDGVATELEDRFLVVAGDLVVDQRLLEWLAAQDSNSLILPAPGAAPEILGSLDRASVRSAARGDGLDAVTVPVTSFPTYWARQRGDVPIHLVRVGNETDAVHAQSVLLDHVDKRTKDLPALLFDPPFENLLVRALAPTTITPNQVTLVTTILAFFGAWLFANGWLLSGVLLAIVVEVLDGVDGKLARIKLMTSRIGELEHVLDFFYENAWYLAIGHFLATTGAPWAWNAALAHVVFDLGDNLAYAFVAHRSGGNLDEVSPFLSRFRLIAGRRNIYVWMLLPGVLAGAASLAYAAVVAWAGLTAVLHWAAASRAGRPCGTEGAKEGPLSGSTVSASAGTQMRSAPARSPQSDSSGTQSPR